MIVLALEGQPSCGKSETLNIVYQFLLNDGYTQLPNKYSNLGNLKMRDFTDILVKGNKKIGIVTQGDYVTTPNSIKNHLSKLFQENCTIAICACTTKNPKAKLQVMHYPQSTFFPKQPTNISSLQRVENNMIAQRIFNSI